MSREHSSRKGVTRRGFLTVAVSAIVAGVVAGAGSYYAGLSAAPVKEVTKTLERTVRETVTTTLAPGAPTTVTTTITSPVTTTVTQRETITTTITKTPEIKPAPKEVKIGFIQPMTGALAFNGKMAMDAMMIAVDMVNREGGIAGKVKIVPVIADAKSDPKVAASETERLCTIEKVSLVIGCFGSAIMLAASEVTEKYKIPGFWTGAITRKAAERGYKYWFHMETLDFRVGESVAQFTEEVIIPKLGKKPGDVNIVSMHEDGPYGTGTHDGAIAYAKERGLNVVERVPYSAKETDFSSVILKVKAAKPDIIWWTAYPSDMVLICRQAKELGLKAKAIIGFGGGTATMPSIKAVGADFNYIFDVGEEAGSVETNKIELLTPKLRNVLKEFEERFKAEHEGMMPMGLDHDAFGHTYHVLTNILPKALQYFGSLDPEAVIEAAESTVVQEGYGSTLPSYGYVYAPPGHPFKGQNMWKLWVNPNVAMQYIDLKPYVVWPPKYAVREPIVPLPSTSPYAAT